MKSSIVTKWMSANPYKTVLFTGYLTFLVTFMALQEFTKEPRSLTFCLGLFAIGIVFFTVSVVRFKPVASR
jgi:hypothetical protein